jgi:acetyl esterase/lipase
MTETIRYGSDPSQFGVLYLPESAAGGHAPPPVVVLIHGGFWRAEYGLDLMVPLAEDLARRGDAVWNIEYRRVGQPGGGWPGTLEDAAAAIDELTVIAKSHPVDLARVAIVGHSAGGQLALWAAGRSALPAGAPGAAPRVVPRVAIGEGPVAALTAADRAGLGGGAVTDLLGGSASEFPERYAIATPSTATTARLMVVRGTRDDVVPAEFTLPPDPERVEIVDVAGADHFDLIDPASAAWAVVVAELTTM